MGINKLNYVSRGCLKWQLANQNQGGWGRRKTVLENNSVTEKSTSKLILVTVHVGMDIAENKLCHLENQLDFSEYNQKKKKGMIEKIRYGWQIKGNHSLNNKAPWEGGE